MWEVYIVYEGGLHMCVSVPALGSYGVGGSMLLIFPIPLCLFLIVFPWTWSLSILLGCWSVSFWDWYYWHRRLCLNLCKRKKKLQNLCFGGTSVHLEGTLQTEICLQSHLRAVLFCNLEKTNMLYFVISVGRSFENVYPGLTTSFECCICLCRDV